MVGFGEYKRIVPLFWAYILVLILIMAVTASFLSSGASARWKTPFSPANGFYSG